MGIRPTYQAAGDGMFDGADAVEHRHVFRRTDPFLEHAEELGVASGDIPITEILRGSDLDALLHRALGNEFLYGGWSEELPIDGGRAPRTDIEGTVDKEADPALILPGVSEETFLTKGDIAQVLPGVTGDEFLLSKDADLPLVLPGDEGGILGGLNPNEGVDVLVGFPTHMLALHPEGGFTGGTDDLGRLHDHDGWLF